MTYYYAVDGDNIGRRLEHLIITNDEDGAARFSREVDSALLALTHQLGVKGAILIFAGGDNLLAKTENWINPEELLMRQGRLTFSLGIGNSPVTAMLALKRAKIESPGWYISDMAESSS